MHVERTDEATFLIDHQKGANPFFFHDSDAFCGKTFWSNRAATFSNDIPNYGRVNIDAALQKSTQVSIRKDPEKGAIRLCDCGHAQFFCSHFNERIPNCDICCNLRDIIPGMHDIPDANQEFAAKTAARM